MQWQQLPLYEDWDYSYSVVIEKINYKIRLLYSDRDKGWTMDVVAPDNLIVVQGKRVNIRDAIALPYYKDLSGIFWLEPKSENINEAYLHPSLISKYFNFYYGWGIVLEDIVERVLVRNETSRVFHITSTLYPVYVNDEISVGSNLVSIAPTPMPSFEDDTTVSRSFLGYNIEGTRYLERFFEDEGAKVGMSFLDYSILSTRYLEEEFEDDGASVGVQLLSVEPKTVLIYYTFEDDGVGDVSRALLGVTIDTN